VWPSARSERGLFALHYPGLLFVFPTPTASTAATAARIVLCAPHAAGGGAHPRLDAVLAAPPPAAPPPAALVLSIGHGLRLDGGGALPFGSSPQDLVAQLGPPSASMVKGTDAMLIHALPTQTLQGAAGGTGEYFLTWFERGLDVLVDGEVRACEHAGMMHRAACADAARSRARTRRTAPRSSWCTQTRRRTRILALTQRRISCLTRRAAAAWARTPDGRRVGVQQQQQQRHLRDV
jgi:hypothetical protein